jgi:predicted membrane-bound spermidine synthase
MNTLRDIFQRYALEVAVFVCGALVMIFEINGSRILAPYLGTSTFIWTSLIGVILAALSTGYWFGGTIADRSSKVTVLASVIFLAGGLVSLTTLTKEVILGTIASFSLGLELKALLGSLFLFAPPSVAFGFVLPFAVKLRLHSVENSGSTVGRLYALSTIGSIFGTFLAGFFLLPWIGSVRTMYLIAGSLFAVSLLLAPLAIRPLNFSSLIVFVFAVVGTESINYIRWSQFHVFSVDTEYSHLTVFQPDDPKTRRKLQAMANDPFFVQSAVFLDSDDLVFEYNRYFHLASYYKPDLKRSLMIGGAAYSFPRDYLRKYPDETIDVVEIDQGMTRLAREYFRLRDDPRMSIYHMDARVFLNQAVPAHYDAILMDAFGTLFSVPYHLTTVEAARDLHRALTDDGVLVANIGAAISGEANQFLWAELATWKSVFADVKLFKVNFQRDDSELQNIIVVALKQSNGNGGSAENFAELLSHEIPDRGVTVLPILTDDLAPVEYYNSIAQRHYHVVAQK